MEPYARKSQTWDLYFDALRFQIDLCTYEEQYELAINEANLMYERAQKVNCARGLIGAKQCLGNVYISTEMGRRNESIGSCLSTLFTNR